MDETYTFMGLIGVYGACIWGFFRAHWVSGARKTGLGGLTGVIELPRANLQHSHLALSVEWSPYRLKLLRGSRA